MIEAGLIAAPRFTLGVPSAASERRGNSVKYFKVFYLKAKALTVLYVPYGFNPSTFAGRRW